MVRRIFRLLFVALCAWLTPATVLAQSTCAPRPLTGCALPGSSTIKITRGTDPQHTRLLWKWKKGTAAPDDFGDPITGTTSYRLCTYDNLTQRPRPQLSIDPDGNWTGTSGRLRYANAGTNSSGVRALMLKAGAGHAAISLKAVGANFAVPSLALNPRSFTAQLVSDTGSCWEATYRPAYRSDSTTRFQASMRTGDVDPTALSHYWPLDGDWHDTVGTADLTPANPGNFSAAPQTRPNGNLAYGPTKSETGNGAMASALTTLPENAGITLAGWALLPDDGTAGVLFGFGGNGWDEPKLNVSVGWGFLYANFGRQNDGAGIQYPRIGDNCWHHLALVLPQGFRAGMRIQFYLDGHRVAPVAIASSATGDASLGPGATLWGSAFQAGAFASPGGSGSAGHMKLDDLQIWTRALRSAEIATLAMPTGVGALCEDAPPPDWAPGPRFVPPASAPTPALDLGVHVLTADTVAIITDPNPWLKARIVADAGPYLSAMEGVRGSLPAYVPNREYDLATKQVIAYYRPNLLAALSGPMHLFVAGTGLSGVATATSLWPQATREFRAPSLTGTGGEIHTSAAEVVYYSFLHLPAAMQPGGTYTASDEWGDTVTWTYDPNQTISWALKVDQVGYLADAAEKYAYLGGWLGPNGGALDVAAFDGQPFDLVRESDGQAVYSGAIALRGDESAPIGGYLLSGERVYQLDFSSFSTPGRYYIRVAGVGRSWSFTIGGDAMGEAFYVHARGLFHQRCAALPSANTPWSRGDAHAPIFQAAHPTEIGAYDDHHADGWGFRDEHGNFPAGLSTFAVIQATATTQIVSNTSGEWHDAGDYDKGGFSHLRIVEYLSEAYLMFPDHFADGQLNLPGSGNGIPDILDEAIWGTDLWRRLQAPDGRVALWVESTSHPQIADAALDTEPYYAGLATRDSSLQYAEHAARLARALRAAGATTTAQVFLDSATRAYTFGTSDFSTVPRIGVTFPFNGHTVSWIEPPAPDPGTLVKALVQLWLATGDSRYFNALNTPAMGTAFANEVGSLYWRNNSFDFVDVALAPDQFPAGWGDTARNGIINTATDWVNAQATHAYRKMWHEVSHNYFPLIGWGSGEFVPIMHAVAAWKVSGDPSFRTAALDAVDWMHGANPQGRVLTTGLGQNSVVQPLHLPSDSDGIPDPVPGITIYAYTTGIPYTARTALYGLFDDPQPAFAFDGSALAQLPPPWNDLGLGLNDVGDILYGGMPLWRNMVTLEANNVPQTEFTVAETIGPAAAVTGCLMPASWMPNTALLQRQPRSAAQLRDALWYQP